MSVKNVTMDPNLLSGAGKTRSKNNKAKGNQHKTKKMSKVKQELIRRLKEHEKIKNGSSVNHKDDGDDKDIKHVASDLKNDVNFMDSMHHLNELIKTARDKKTRKKKNKDDKKTNFNVNDSFESSGQDNNIICLETETFDEKVIKNDAPWVSLVPGPSYGNLKNGTKPTYRKFNKTKSNRNRIIFDNKCDTICIPEIDDKMKAYENPVVIKALPVQPVLGPEPEPIVASVPPPIVTPAPMITSEPIVTPADVALSKAIDDHIDSKLKQNSSTPVKNKRKTIRVGRSGDNVTFLLKSNKTRKIVKTIEMNACQEKISNIRRKLIKHKLIKPNCDAPDSILRDMYKTMCITNVDLMNERQPTRIEDIIEQ